MVQTKRIKPKYKIATQKNREVQLTQLSFEQLRMLEERKKLERSQSYLEMRADRFIQKANQNELNYSFHKKQESFDEIFKRKFS